MPSIRSTDGTEIDYRTTGEGPTDLILMHGWAGSGAYFDDLIAHLDLSRIRAITVDLRGHGKSERSESGYTLDQITDDVMAVADAAGTRRFVLVGFSMSGKFAQYVSSVHPDRVLGQVLVAGCPAVAVPLPPELGDERVDQGGQSGGLLDWYLVSALEELQPRAQRRGDRLEHVGGEHRVVPAADHERGRGDLRESLGERRRRGQVHGAPQGRERDPGGLLAEPLQPLRRHRLGRVRQHQVGQPTRISGPPAPVGDELGR